MRGRNRTNKGPNPLTRSYESNGPDVKIRGTAQHIAEKYSQLARDAQASGDPVAAENYFQHAEHYFRIIATAQEQLREQFGYQQRPFDEEGDEDGSFGDRQGFGGDDGDFGSQPQPFEPRQDGDRPQRFDNRQDSRQDNRQDNRQERGDQQRFDRNDRSDRGDRQGQDRGERQDRGDRFDRGDRRDRFSRPDRPRQEFQPRDGERQDRGEPRQDRGERGDFPRRDRAPERRREETEAVEGGGLPAFLTNPVRPAIASDEPALDSEANGAAVNGEGHGDYRLRRRRRRGRGFGDENGAEPTTDFVPEAEIPPAE